MDIMNLKDNVKDIVNITNTLYCIVNTKDNMNINGIVDIMNIVKRIFSNLRVQTNNKLT